MPLRDRLLERERGQHTQHDDPLFLQELAHAMKRLRPVYVHGAPPAKTLA